MKNMASLMKIELILMKRQAAYYLLSIGLPSVFYPVSYTHLTLPTKLEV